MKNLVILVLFFAICTQAKAQVDTVYFNKSGEETTAKNAYLKRAIIENDSNSYLLLKEFDRDNKPLCIYSVRDLVHFKKEGKYESFYNNGQTKYIMHYQNNFLQGPLIGYYEDGSVRRIDKYVDGNFVEGRCMTKSGKDTTHFEYYVPANYANGGIQGFSKFLIKNVAYPEKAQKKGIEGRVYVAFIIEKDGEITDVTVRRKVNKYLDKEAIRVVKKSSGSWQPAIWEGVPRRTSYTVPINFRLR